MSTTSTTAAAPVLPLAIAGIVLTEAQIAAYIQVIENHGRKRAKQRGDDFNVDDYLIGASIFLAESVGMAALPSSWIFGLMSGVDPLTGERPAAIDEAGREIRRAVKALSNAATEFDKAGGEGTNGLPADTTFSKARGALESVRNLIGKNKARIAKASAE